MKTVEFNDIHRAFHEGTDVLDGVSFSMEKGEVVGLLGKNGAGKTTLLRIAMGMLEPQQGSVRILGLDPREAAVEVKRRVGYVSEDQVLPGGLSVGAVIDFHRDLFPSWDDEMATALAERFALPARKKIKSLSKGQARQVALLCAVAHRPEVLLLDEPAGGLDPSARREFLETSIELLNQAGSTILFSSHHMGDVERVAGRVVMLEQGKVLVDDKLDALRESYCLALIPHDAGMDKERILNVRDCLTVRQRSDAFHAIVRCDAGSCASLLSDALGVNGVRCTALALEEMFIEMVGGES